MKKVFDLRLTEKEWLTPQVIRMSLEGELCKEVKFPGQFVHVKVGDGGMLLRRPISIHKVDVATNTIDIIFRVEGDGTKKLATYEIGDMLDVMGPLGNGFTTVQEARKGDVACIIGGGIGTPPLYQLSKDLIAKGVKVIHILGFGTKNDCILIDEFEKLGPTYVSTVDGSVGVKGFVTDILIDELIEADVYYACGPTSMLKALEREIRDVPLFLSFEERMACGMGACYACVCKTESHVKESYKRVCKDGPVFQAGEVIV